MQEMYSKSGTFLLIIYSIGTSSCFKLDLNAETSKLCDSICIRSSKKAEVDPANSPCKCSETSNFDPIINPAIVEENFEVLDDRNLKIKKRETETNHYNLIGQTPTKKRRNPSTTTRPSLKKPSTRRTASSHARKNFSTSRPNRLITRRSSKARNSHNQRLKAVRENLNGTPHLQQRANNDGSAEYHKPEDYHKKKQNKKTRNGMATTQAGTVGSALVDPMTKNSGNDSKEKKHVRKTQENPETSETNPFNTSKNSPTSPETALNADPSSRKHPSNTNKAISTSSEPIVKIDIPSTPQNKITSTTPSPLPNLGESEPKNQLSVSSTTELPKELKESDLSSSSTSPESGPKFQNVFKQIKEKHHKNLLKLQDRKLVSAGGRLNEKHKQNTSRTTGDGTLEALEQPKNETPPQTDNDKTQGNTENKSKGTKDNIEIDTDS